MDMLIDTHIHLDYLPDPAAAIAVARRSGVGGWVVPGVAPRDWPKLLTLVSATPGAWAAPGVHPCSAADWRPEQARELARLAGASSTVAIGEVGLDGMNGPAREFQEAVFRQMIRIARETGRPLLVHARKATARLLQLLHEERAAEVGGIVHAYSGSIETARQLINLRFALGIGGVVTYPEALRLSEVVRRLPADWLVLETDAPDLAPVPHRGADNQPAWLKLVAERVAQLRGWDLAETARVTAANTRRVLHLKGQGEDES